MFSREHRRLHERRPVSSAEEDATATLVKDAVDRDILRKAVVLLTLLKIVEEGGTRGALIEALLVILDNVLIRTYAHPRLDRSASIPCHPGRSKS